MEKKEKEKEKVSIHYIKHGEFVKREGIPKSSSYKIDGKYVLNEFIRYIDFNLT